MTDLPITEDKLEVRTNLKVWKITWTVLKYTFLLLFIGILFGGGAGVGYVASLVKDQPALSHDEMQERIFSNAETSFAYFNDKELIGHLRTEEDRRMVKVGDVSPFLIKAIIATEDRYFYEHHGVNPNGLMRAATETLMGSPVQTGGSSLTQQLVKQTILTPEVSLERKAKEIFLALRMERMFTKDQILEAYINKMYFGKNANGSNIYGVQTAAKGIFGVDAKNLNIAQAAYIAGMLQAPSRYIPFNPDGLKAGKDRQKIVLDRMLENGFITAQQYQESLKYDIKEHLKPADQVQAYSQYPYLMMEIENQAARMLLDQDIKKNPELSQKNISAEEYQVMLDDKRKEILTGGYHIYTTIDKNIYEMMTDIAENPKNFDSNRSYTVNGVKIKNALEQVGATLIDNKTGAVLGFIGGRDFEVSQLNHTSSPRQPGSAMKPLAAYAPAFEKGLLQPGSVIDDSKIALENGAGNPPFYPSNYDNRFHGLMTARVALEKSYNIPAIKAYLQVGIPEALGYVKKMGVTTLVTPEDNPGRNDYQAKTGVIGGLTQGLTVEEITNAYSVFANQGLFLDSYLIQKITDSSQKSIYEHTASPQMVFSKQTAYLMTDMMRTVVKSGTASGLKKYIGNGRDVAGKTGTTNDDNDSWFVGYTPEVSLGVWIGYDIPHSLPKAKPPRSLQIWGKIMRNLFEMYPDQFPKNSKFDRPSGIVYKEICRRSGKLASEVCRQEGTVITEIFNAKYVPTKIDDSVPMVLPDAENTESEEIKGQPEQTQNTTGPVSKVKEPSKPLSERKEQTTDNTSKKSGSTKQEQKKKPQKEKTKSDDLFGDIIPPDPTKTN